MARPAYILHKHLNIIDLEATNGKLFCVNQQHVLIHQPTQHTDTHNSNVPLLGLKQQHEELCSNTPRVDSEELAISGHSLLSKIMYQTFSQISVPVFS